jgi:hypothetical protein
MSNEEIRHEYKIVIVGAGGTGGTLASMLARYLYSKKTDEIRQFKLYLIDGDLVDEKNINRQPFSSDDVGCFKVDCLSEAYTEVYGISVFPFPTYIDKVKEFENIVGSDWLGTSRFYDVKQHIILIGAVDNHRARQTMHTYFDSVSLDIKTDIIYIDSANEFDFGTVVAGYRNFSGVQCPDRTFYFPDVLKSRAKKASQLSCGAINISAPQHYVTNQLAATITFSQICSFIENGEYKDGVTYFHSFNLSVSYRSLENFLADTYRKYNVSSYPDLLVAMKNAMKNGGNNDEKAAKNKGKTGKRADKKNG